MDGQFVLYLGQEAVKTALLMAAPVLAVTLVVGLLTAMLQAVTSVRDMTLGLVLKLTSVAVTLLFCGGWMLHLAIAFTAKVFADMRALGS